METYITIRKTAKRNSLYVSGNSNELCIHLEGRMGSNVEEMFKKERIYVYIWLTHVVV